jgi:hypothetical protein
MSDRDHMNDEDHMNDLDRAAKDGDPRRLIKAMAVKDAAMDDAGGMQCWPSVTGVLDLYGDVIFPGAFGKCLAPFLRRGFVPMDHEWHWSALVGFPTLAEERGNKLYSEFTFHSDGQSQDARTKCRERMAAGLEVGLSIGFSMMPGQYVYFGSGKELLAYAKKQGQDMSLFDAKGIAAYAAQCCAIVEIEELWEYSLTPAPANQQAMAVAVKSAPSGHVVLSANGLRLTDPPAGDKDPPAGDKDPPAGDKDPPAGDKDPPAGDKDPPAGDKTKGHRLMTARHVKTKTICGGAGLPLADEEQAWSASDADRRLRAFTEATDEPNAGYAKAFVAVTGPADDFSSYVLPIADVVGGELKAVPQGLQAAAAALAGDDSGLSGQDLECARTFLGGYLAAMGRDSAWGDAVAVWKGQYLGDYVEYSMCMSAMYQAHSYLQYEVADALEGYGDYADMSDGELYDAIGCCFDEHKALCMSVIRAIRSGAADETPQQAALSARRSMFSQLSSLGDGLSYTKHARVTVDASRALLGRTKSRAEMRLKEGRALSEANRQVLKDHRDALTECVGTIDAMLAQTEPKDGNGRTEAEKAAVAARARRLHAQFLELQFGH